MPVKNRLTREGKKELDAEIELIESEKGYKICGARDKSRDGPCIRKVGWGTDHLGIGRCKMHGGLNQSPSSGRYTTGITAKIKYPDIIEKVKQLREDRDVFDLRDHIFLAEASAQAILENVTEADDLLPLVKVVDTITKMVQRLHEIEVGRRYVISVENLGNVIGRVVEVIERHVPDPYLRSLIAADLLKINNMPIPALDNRLIEAQLVNDK